MAVADEDGNQHCARIVQAIEECDEEIGKQYLKFFVKYDNSDKANEIIAYNDIICYVNKEIDRDDDEEVWHFKRISAHQGPLTTKHPAYKGSKYNVQVEWEDGSVMYEPLCTIATDDPVTCAVYAKNNGLLDVPRLEVFQRHCL